MKIEFALVFCSILAVISNAKGGLTSPRSTLSPNDVAAPPIQPIYVPTQEKSSKTDAILSAMGFASAILPYIGQVTQMLKNDEVEHKPDVASSIVARTDQVSRLKRRVAEDFEDEIVTDSFLGSILSPANVILETAIIILDVLAVTKEQGLTDYQSDSVRNRREILSRDSDLSPFGTVSNALHYLTVLTTKTLVYSKKVCHYLN